MKYSYGILDALSRTTACHVLSDGSRGGSGGGVGVGASGGAMAVAAIV